MNKIFKILEIFWLVAGFIGVLLCAYSIVGHDQRSAIFFLVYTLACGMMYAFRKRQRTKFEASKKTKEPTK